ncbi:MAG: phage tail protein [Clostridiales bacterium]|nr:phage tail protein [Clostridiales bacterium]
MEGFTVENGNTLILDKTTGHHYMFFRAIDGVAGDSFWGRFTCKLNLSEEMVCYIYVYASNFLTDIIDGRSVDISDYLCDPEIEEYKKISLFTGLGAKRFVNTDDFLLYDITGRYLYVAVEMLGNGDASIGNIRVGARGDNFLGSFPEVYRERNSFFHRYLSIFSSIYNDISEQNEKLYEMLDIDKCSPDLLEMYGSWFGIDLKGGSLPEDVLRRIVKEAYQLNRMKGTRWALERILELLLQDDFVMYENRLNNGEIFEVTVLINRKVTEQLRHQLVFLLDQFKPLRVKIRLLQMEKEAVMDGNSYLDMNATIPSEKHVVLDEEAIYDGAITLL